MRSSGDSGPVSDDEARRAPRYPREMKKKQFNEAEQKAFEAWMAAAGITIATPKPGTATITLLKKLETKAMTGRAGGRRNV